MRRAETEPKKRRAVRNAAERRAWRALVHRRSRVEKRRRRGREQEWRTIRAPARLSLRDNADEASAFIAALEECRAQKRRVYVNLDGVRELTPDACAVLASVVEMFKRRRIRVKGSVPREPRAAAMLLGSGFFDYVQVVRGAQPTATHGTMRRKTDQDAVADPHVAEKLVKFAANRTLGESIDTHQPSYRCVMECMANTRNHASPEDQKREPWWLAVYYDPNTKVSSFSFLDLGIGILNSVNLVFVRKVMRSLGVMSNAKILHDLLDGSIGSRTGFSYRGKGLPALAKACQRSKIRRLVIVANDVYADVERDVFRRLVRPLSGTFVYWELHP